VIRGDGFLQRAVPLRAIDIDWPYLHAVLARIAHQLRGRVEAHRLRVQNGGKEYIGMVAFHPA